jgi:glycine dehydrogenase
MAKGSSSFSELENQAEFVARHVGPGRDEQQAMLKILGLKSLDELVAQTVPAQILNPKPLDLGESVSEADVILKARAFANQNQVFKTFIGMGYFGTHTPPVILRNVMENPGWYTAYTPYQAEIAQGRLEALLNFQTMIMDLTGMEIANASLLDEGTATAEAMHLCHSAAKNSQANKILVWHGCHPQTIEVLQRRAEPLGIEVVVSCSQKFIFNEEVFACVVQYPGTKGGVKDFKELVEKAHAAKALVVVATDLLALTMLKPPGEWGADVVVGSSQRFGVPLGYGGPHAGFMATKDEFKRAIPGRLVGVSIDADGRPALRLALQTREQHIRREKATSNICTAQVLLAVMASMYAVYHGPKGLKRIARRTHRLAATFNAGLKKLSLVKDDKSFFDTVTVDVGADADRVMAKALELKYNLRRIDNETIGVSFDETSSRKDVENLWKAFALASKTPMTGDFDSIESSTPDALPENLLRKSEFLTHPVFNSYHSETEMLRYMNRLQSKDFSLVHDEAQRNNRDDSRDMAGVQSAASILPDRPG